MHLFATAFGAAFLFGSTAALPSMDRYVSGTERHDRIAVRPTAFDLFLPGSLLLEGNRVGCIINDTGQHCVDVSPVVGGGHWPKGTPDQYIFGSGIQVSAIVGGTDGPGFPWPGDTVGAFFWDERGVAQHGVPLTAIFDSRTSPHDLWPSAARVIDTALFADLLIGRDAVSEQDSWVRFWDLTGPASSRAHPMGVLVEQRTLAWNYPLGNDDIIYKIFRFINVTASTTAPYAGLASLGYSAADIADFAALGRVFKDSIQATSSVNVPAGGFSLDQFHVGFAADQDVGQASQNYSTANLPFDLMAAYRSDFNEPNWHYPPEIFTAPFAERPGVVAEAFLRAPGNPGLVLFSNTANPFPAPSGVHKLWRMQSANLIPADGFCSVPLDSAAVRRLCAVFQAPRDTRGYMSTGPFTLPPGGSVTIVMAMVMGAPVATMTCSAAEGACPGGTWSLAPFVGGNLVPGLPAHGRRLVQGVDTVHNIDRVMGWASHADADGDGAIEWNEVQTVRRSLLWKVQLAHAVLDNRFLLPQPPDAPRFFAIPGDRSATIVWQPSATEESGDPYFAAASTPGTPLYDPNFRRFDVEGYRVWRGTSPSTMRVVAVFDYANTSMIDSSGLFITPTTGNYCAPEIGVTASCPPSPNPIPLSGQVVQVRPGGRIQLASGFVAVIRSDTVPVVLVDAGVPLVFADTGLTNGQQYWYAVTAFDVNSLSSGPASMESAPQPRLVTPRVSARQESGGGLGPLQLVGGDGTILNPSAPVPSLDPATGIFSGPMPPTNGIVVSLETVLPQLLGTGTLEVRLDSIVPGSVLTSLRPTVYHFTRQNGPAPVRFAMSFQGDRDAGGGQTTFWDQPNRHPEPFVAIPADQTQAARFGGDSTYALRGLLTLTLPGSWALTAKGRGDANGYPMGSPYNGPRWWAGATNENTAAPNGLICASPPPVGNGSFTCALGDLSRNSGQIGGVEIFGIRSYTTVGTTTPARDFEGITSTVMRAADFKWYWGNVPGTVDSVVDVTHRVRVPFSPRIRASWGILNDSSFTNTLAARTHDGDNAKLTWGDIFCVDPGPAYLAGACNVGGANANPAFLMNHARASAVAFASSTLPATAGLAVNGTGFIIYLNGEWFMIRVPVLPSNTVWNARFYAGHVIGAPGTFTFTSTVIRPPAVPGLVVRADYTGSTLDASATAGVNLTSIHTIPDPYYYTSTLEYNNGRQMMRFVNLPARAVIRIYSVSGILVGMITHNDATDGGEAEWDVRNRAGRPVASGVYFYHVQVPDGRTRIGRFTVVNADR